MKDEEAYNYSHERMFEMQVNYTYFILAVNASAIGFSIQMTIEKAFRLETWILLVAILFWAISFNLGGAFLRNYILFFKLNKEALKEDWVTRKNIVQHNSYKKMQEAQGSFGMMFGTLKAGITFFIIWYLVTIFNLFNIF